VTRETRKILVVDDDATVRILLRAALRQAGFEVGLAVDGTEGLRQFRTQRWDLVMLDVEMPDLSGYEVCKLLRAEVGELLPIVMVTGMDNLQSIDRAYDSGATDFISKPINRALLGHRVKYLLRGHQALLDLRSAHANSAAILQALPDPLFEVDLDGRILDFHAPRPRRAVAAPPQEFLGKRLVELLSPQATQECLAALHEAHAAGYSAGRQVEMMLGKGLRWFELSVSRKTVGEGCAPRFVVLSRDVTQRKRAEQKIARLAHFDSLTGLPNRQNFLDRVGREIARAGRDASQLGVLFMDLDGFKQVNDTLGHAAGDEVLQAVAERLRDVLRPSDVVSRYTEGGDSDVELARLGGDEFTALLLNLEQPGDALAVAQRIRDAIARPFFVQGRRVTIGTSIGIAVYPSDGDAAALLLDRADAAMYRAKTEGGSGCVLYADMASAKAVDLLAAAGASD
jgi:diguanylate cyclase (GGDEF)-like protein/PAS domain S-box-containing protein